MKTKILDIEDIEDIDKSEKWLNETDRFEKMDWLNETSSEEFMRYHLIDEMTCWFGEKDFSKFFEHLCSCWEIKNPGELEAEEDEDEDE